jgi:hypothetical protein
MFLNIMAFISVNISWLIYFYLNVLCAAIIGCFLLSQERSDRHYKFAISTKLETSECEMSRK